MTTRDLSESSTDDTVEFLSDSATIAFFDKHVDGLIQKLEQESLQEKYLVTEMKRREESTGQILRLKRFFEQKRNRIFGEGLAFALRFAKDDEDRIAITTHVKDGCREYIAFLEGEQGLSVSG